MTLAALAALLSLGADSARAPDSLADFMQHGISHDLARWRAQTIGDVRYDLSLDVTAPDSAVGSVTVRFTRRGSDDLILDYRGRHLGVISVNGTGYTGAFTDDHLRIPSERLAAGENTVTLAFVSDIAPTGASIIRVHDPSDRQD